jgi:hypothetical protein
MTTVAWEKVKTSACKLATKRIIGPLGVCIPDAAIMDAISKRQTLHQSIDELVSSVHNTIMSWDVRCAPKLRELFPNAFPVGLRSGNLSAFMNEAGDWCITK